jgi:hypothetical protein
LAADRAGAWLVAVRVTGMFALTSVGWLIFRQDRLNQLWRDLRLSPVASTGPARRGFYLFLLAGLYSCRSGSRPLGRVRRPSLMTAVARKKSQNRARRDAGRDVRADDGGPTDAASSSS